MKHNYRAIYTTKIVSRGVWIIEADGKRMEPVVCYPTREEAERAIEGMKTADFENTDDTH